MYDRKKIKDLKYDERFVFRTGRETEYVVDYYDESDNTYYVYECGNVENGMFVSGEKEVFVRGMYRW